MIIETMADRWRQQNGERPDGTGMQARLFEALGAYNAAITAAESA